ncbi:MAG: hypothetical protein KDD69_08280 [Bdellovibrionales bacterium]|nr:hypothetical protein [Bdellovibrionales bacterium]
MNLVSRKALVRKMIAGLALSALAPGMALADEDSRLDEMISPVTNPVNFEDPRSISSVRPIFMFHKIPSDFITGSGDIQLWAAQVRLALTDRLAFLATKDGYIQINSDKVLADSEGSANLAGGFQYAFYKDDAAGEIATAGLRYEAQTGDPDVFQGTGDGIISPHLSGAIALGDINLMGYTDLRLGVNDEDSDFWDVSLHADYPIANFYPSLELNMAHVVDSGHRLPLEGEGFDLVNFGSAGSDGSTVVTLGVGGRYRAAEWLDLGASYEFPLTDREDIFAWRMTFDLIFKCKDTLL